MGCTCSSSLALTCSLPLAFTSPVLTCGNSCPNSHKAFMSIQRQVSFFDGVFKVKGPPDVQ